MGGIFNGGSKILKRMVAEAIDSLDKARAPAEVKAAITLALRLGEMSLTNSRIIMALIVVLMLLLVEVEGESVEAVRTRLSQVVDRVEREEQLAASSHVAWEPEDVELFWQLARRFVPTLYRLQGSSRPVPFI